LGEQRRNVVLHGPLGNVEARSYLTIAQSLGCQAQHLQLALAQSLPPRGVDTPLTCGRRRPGWGRRLAGHEPVDHLACHARGEAGLAAADGVEVARQLLGWHVLEDVSARAGPERGAG